jgi:hypothetical protein
MQEKGLITSDRVEEYDGTTAVVACENLMALNIDLFHTSGALVLGLSARLWCLVFQKSRHGRYWDLAAVTPVRTAAEVSPTYSILVARHRLWLKSPTIDRRFTLFRLQPP